MSMEQALQTFIEESRELPAAMEYARLSLAASPDETDAICAVFRAMQTIPGSGEVTLNLDIPSLIQRAPRNESRVSGTALRISPMA